MRALDQLLAVQAHDTLIAQLVHKRATLPERSERTSLAEQLLALDQQAAPLAEQRHELRLEQGRLEDQTAILEAKQVSEDKKLYSGAVTGAKDLQALQEEIASLKRHQSSVEDDILALMVAAEPLDEQLADVEQRKADAVERLEAVAQAITIAEAEIDAQLESEQAKRAADAAEVGEELLSRYASIRDRAAGVGIARFVAGRCEGCHLTMSAMEADRVKKAPADEVVTCESCERILVR